MSLYDKGILDTRRRPCGKGGRAWSAVANSQGTPSIARSTGSWKREEFPPRAFRGSLAPRTPWLWTSSLQSCDRISFCCYILCSPICDPMDCSLPGSSVHGILQAGILEWVAISFSRGSSWHRDGTRSPALQADSLSSELPGKLLYYKLPSCDTLLQ